MVPVVIHDLCQTEWQMGNKLKKGLSTQDVHVYSYPPFLPSLLSYAVVRRKKERKKERGKKRAKGKKTPTIRIGKRRTGPSRSLVH